MKSIAALVVLGMLAGWAEGTDYYVSPQGDDEAAGTSLAAPWRTIAKASASVVPGDTVRICGGTYAEAIAPAASGTEDAPITFTAHGDEPVVLTEVDRGITLIDCAYLVIDGISCDRTGEYLRIQNCHHVRVKDCTFDNSSRTDGWPNGVVITDDSHHNRISNCRIARTGYSTSNDDKGGLMVIGRGSNRNVIENCTLAYGGHHVLQILSTHNVIRNNYFHNEEWMDTPHRTETGGKAGNRLMILEGRSAWNVLEGNVVAFSGLPPDQDGSSGVSVRTSHNIVRRNVFYENDGAGLNIYSAGGRHDVRFNHAYHNTFFRNAYAAKSAFEPFLCGLSLTKHGSGSITDVSVVNNILWRNKNDAAFSFYYCERADQDVRGNWEEQGPPIFVNDRAVADPLKPGVLDFRLQPQSPCIDAGEFLTQTTAAGRGVRIPVADAGFFTNGYGVVEGDLIQIQGVAQLLRVTGVDYEANVVQVDWPVTWEAGQGVAQPFNGARPDIGAFER